MAIDPELVRQNKEARERLRQEKEPTTQDLFNIKDTDDRDISVASQETKDSFEPIEVNNPLAFAFKLGVLDTARGIQQITGANKEKLKEEQRILNNLMRGPDGKKITAAYFAGAIVDPASWLIPFGKARSLFAMGRYGMVSGAIAGAAGYVDTEEGLFKTRGQQIVGSAIGAGVLAPTAGGLFNLGVQLTGKGNKIPLSAKRRDLSPGEAVNKEVTHVQTYGTKVEEDRKGGKIFTEGDVTTPIVEEDIGKEVTPVFSLLTNIFGTRKKQEFPQKTEVLQDRPEAGKFTGIYGLKRKATAFLDDIFENYEKNIGKRILKGAKTAEGGGAIAGGVVGFSIDPDEPLSTRFGLAIAGATLGALGGVAAKKKRFTKKVKILKTDESGKPVEEIVEQEQSFADILGRLFIDKYGLSENYKTSLNNYDGTLNDIAGQFVRVAKKAAELDNNQRKVLYNMLEGDIKYKEFLADPNFVGPPEVISKKLNTLKDEIRQLITDHGQRYVDLGLITKETFERNVKTYIGRLYRKYADNLIKVGDELKPRGLLIDDQYTAEDFLRVLRNVEPTIDDQKILNSEGIVHKGWELFGDLAVVKLTRTKKGGKFVNEIQSETEDGNAIVKVLKRDPPTENEARLGQKGKITKFKRLEPKDKVSVRWQYTKPQRLALGEIEDAAIITEYTGQVMANTIAKYSFFAKVAQDFGKVGKGVTEEITSIKGTGTKMEIEAKTGKFYDQVTEADLEAGYKQIPKSILKGTKQVQFGKLAGKFVPREVWNDIVAGARYQKEPSSFFYKEYKKLNNLWKISKTAWNPTVHVNNIFGNIFLSDLANVPLTTLPEAARALFLHGKKGKESQLVRDAISYGVFDADFIRKELKNFKAEDLADIYKTREGANEWSKSVSIANNLYRQVKNNKITGTLENWYRVEDHVFRLNAFAHRIRLGDTYEDAAKFARKQFIDYDIDAPVINWARNTAVPFLSFSYRMIPILVETAVLRPHKYFKYAALGYGLTKLEEMYGGDEAKRERALLPEYEAGNILDLPFMPKKTIRIPVKDKNGRPKFVNISRLFPGGDLTSFDGSRNVPFLPEPLQPNFGVGGEVLSSIIGYDLFLQRREPGRGSGEVLEETGAILNSLSKKLIPNFPFVPGAYSTQKLNRALRGDKSPFREPQSEAEALMNAFGFKISNKSFDTLARRKKLELDKKVRVQKYKLKGIKNDLNNGSITRADFDRKASKIQTKIYELTQEFKLRLIGYDPYAVRIFDDVMHTMNSGDSVSETEEKKETKEERLLRYEQKR